MAKTDSKIENIRDRINTIKDELALDFVERDEEIHGLTTAILSDANVLFLGEPGVGKSRLVRLWQKHIKEANYFYHLLSQFTVPEELAGSVSLSELENDRYVRNTEGMLPEAHLAFLDEVWKGNSGVLNFLLPLLNERTYFNDGESRDSNLLTIVGASNELPEEQDHLDAAVDRFVLKYFVKDVTEQGNYIRMMRDFLNFDPEKELTHISLDEIYQARDYIYNIDVPNGILTSVYKIINQLGENHNIRVSPRVANQSLRVAQANAFLNGHEEVTELDLGILQNVYWTEPQQKSIVQKVILQQTNPSGEKINELMHQASEIYEETKAEAKTRNSNNDGEEDPEFTAIVLGALNKLQKKSKKIKAIKEELEEKDQDTKMAKESMKKIYKYSLDLSDNNLAIQYSGLDSI